MRLRILAKTEKLPVIYRHRILALIKEALKGSNQKYKDILYGEEKPKPFTFSLLLPKEREQKREVFSLSDGIEIEDYVFYFPKDSFLSLLISSYDYEFLMNLYNGLLKIKSFAFNKEITINIYGFSLQEDPKIEEDVVVFKTLSPILVENKDGKPLLKENGSFDSNLLN
ncbi:MAG: CRISPR-associated endoribonuclease Cas6, partial [Aquificaceae bacterium]